jgi:hypothetical protein
MDDITGGDINGAMSSVMGCITGGDLHDVTDGAMSDVMGDVQVERDYVSPSR